MRVTALNLYPVKSMRGCSVQEAQVKAQGLQGDREWLITDETGRFRSARECPQMLLWRPQMTGSGLRLVAPDGQMHDVHKSAYTSLSMVSVWSDTFQAYGGPEDTDRWLSEKMGIPCRLLYLGQQSHRILKESNQAYSFADGAPYLITTQASLDSLNAHLPLQDQVTMAHFRPNIVLDGLHAYAEDDWREIRIGAIEFTGFKPCKRCKIVTLNPDSAEMSKTQEPLRTLAKTHKLETAGAYFGVNFYAHATGYLRLGDEAQLL